MLAFIAFTSLALALAHPRVVTTPFFNLKSAASTVETDTLEARAASPAINGGEASSPDCKYHYFAFWADGQDQCRYAFLGNMTGDPCVFHDGMMAIEYDQTYRLTGCTTGVALETESGAFRSYAVVMDDVVGKDCHLFGVYYHVRQLWHFP